MLNLALVFLRLVLRFLAERQSREDGEEQKGGPGGVGGRIMRRAHVLARCSLRNSAWHRRGNIALIDRISDLWQTAGRGGKRDERRWEGRDAQPFRLSDGGEGGDGATGTQVGGIVGKRQRGRRGKKVLRPVQRRPQRQ